MSESAHWMSCVLVMMLPLPVDGEMVIAGVVLFFLVVLAFCIILADDEDWL